MKARAHGLYWGALAVFLAFLGTFIAAGVSGSYLLLSISLGLFFVPFGLGYAGLKIDASWTSAIQYPERPQRPSGSNEWASVRIGLDYAHLVEQAVERFWPYLLLAVLGLAGGLWLGYNAFADVDENGGEVVAGVLVPLSAFALALFAPIFVNPMISEVLLARYPGSEVWPLITNKELRTFAAHWSLAENSARLRRRGFVTVGSDGVELWQRDHRALACYAVIPSSDLVGAARDYVLYGGQSQPCAVVTIHNRGGDADITLPLLPTSRRALRYLPDRFVVAVNAARTSSAG